MIERASTNVEFFGVVKLAHFSAHWQYVRLVQGQSEAEGSLAAVRGAQGERG